MFLENVSESRSFFSYRWRAVHAAREGGDLFGGHSLVSEVLLYSTLHLKWIKPSKLYMNFEQYPFLS